MRSFSLWILSIFLSIGVYAADGAYMVSKIPTQLLERAHAVKRCEDIRFEVISLDKARHYHKYAITVLRDQGDSFAEFQAWYDRFHEIVSIQGTLYDARGEKIKSLRKSDIKDVSGTDDNSLADDNRLKQFSFSHRVYPYTVEFEVEIIQSYTMFYPTYMPVSDEFLSVEQSSMSVVLRDGIEFRYKQGNIDAPLVKKESGRQVYTWQLKQFAALKQESFRPSRREIAPFVFMAPVAFEVQRYQGSMNTWDDFGNFIIALKAGRDVLPKATRDKVHELTDAVKDPHEKIRILYRYMQANTRYVSVQLGVGGWQPYDATYVAERKYGDCKALANYMYALLKEAGIRSCYTLIRAGDGNTFFLPDFPSSQFNHIILSVPLKSDTVWLECTSQNMPAGYLSGFTADRYALMVQEAGASLVRTPKYDYRVNTQYRNVQATVDAEGHAIIHTHTKFKAMAQDDLHGIIHAWAPDKVKEYLNRSISLPQYDLVDFSYQESVADLPVITENLQIKATHFATVSGKRMFIMPNLFSKTGFYLGDDTVRKYDVLLQREFQDIDTVTIAVPTGYRTEVLPQPIHMESRFGRYTASAVVAGDRIIYYRHMERYSGRFPAASYAELVKFYEKVYKADRMRVVLVL
jgi:transglutaminase-like putative cysteine protease